MRSWVSFGFRVVGLFGGLLLALDQGCAYHYVEGLRNTQDANSKSNGIPIKSDRVILIEPIAGPICEKNHGDGLNLSRDQIAERSSEIRH